MAYWLGIDLGTTYTAAATVDDGGRVDIVTLGGRATSIPSVLFLGEDSGLLVGDAANRRALSEPTRVARQFKRRLGDPTPLLVGGTPISAQSLMARLLRWTVDHVVADRGTEPVAVAVTHPANWGPYKLELLDQAIRLADLPGARIITEPEAAAVAYAERERIEPGEAVAVYDLGGGTFDAAVLRRTETGFELAGRPEGIEHLGGIDIDEAVFGIVARQLGSALDGLDPDDPLALAAVARLRQDCVEAKEALSTDTEARIPVLLPGVQTEVTVTRTQLEEAVDPLLADTVGALHRALQSAGVPAGELRSVLLVGGSSRLPIVARIVEAALGRPVALDAHPKHAVAHGAALVAAGRAGVAASSRPTLPPPTPPPAPAPAPAAAPPAMAQTLAEVASGEPWPAETPSRATRRGAVIGALVGVVVVVGAAIALSAGDGDGDGGEAASGATTTVDPYGAAPTTDRADVTTTTARAGLAPVTPGASGRGVRIDDVVVKQGTYEVSYRTVGYDPVLSTEAGTHHLHFFFDNVAPEHAGQQSATPGRWVLWDVPSPFTGYRVADRPADAHRICALVADHTHNVELDSGNCVPLPVL